MMKKVPFPLLIFLAVLCVPSPLSAQKVTTEGDGAVTQGWYLGIEGGLPFGLSTFSSFGHDKTHAGWSSGLYGGYRFNPILSAELTARYGQMTLTAQNCCTDRSYWLGADGVRYNAPVLGMDCWNYRDLQSRVSMGQYGARLNVNILGFFRQMRNSRWSVSLSPHLYAVSTKSHIRTSADGTERLKGKSQWHIGYGDDLQVACQITSCLQLAVYTGVTGLTGSKMDALPEYLHKNNLVWESGLRLGYLFECRKK